MTTASVCPKLLQAVSETFETMIFTQVVLWNQPPGDLSKSSAAVPPRSYWCSIPVISPLKGSMLMIIPATLAVEITKNLYGWTDNAELTETVELDAIAELVNTISGRLLSFLLPEDQSFELGLPETSETPLEYPQESAVCKFAAGEDTFACILTGDLATL
ncbi:MAG: chemotaxis protein CheX [Thermodesulfobacteriota bacterium]